MTQKTQVGHYVPQVLLKNFSFSKKGERYVFAFDKHAERTFAPNIARIVAERGFYEIEVDGNKMSFEAIFSDLEGMAAPVLKKLIENENLTCLTPEDSETLLVFIAFQYWRVKKQREVFKGLNEDMCEHIKRMGHDPEKVDGFKALTEEEVKAFTIKQIPKMISVVSELLRAKNCILFKAPSSNPLYIGDHPVTLHNDKDFGFYGNIGFAVPGIQIYMPISSRLAIGFWCTDIQKDLEQQWAEQDRLALNLRAKLLLGQNIDKKKIEKTLEIYEMQLKERKKFLQAVEKGSHLAVPTDTVTFLNSLQVAWSHRYVMCETESFDLAKKMIADNESHRKGIKITSK